MELRKGVAATLPFEDKRDFDEAKKGFIAEPPYQKIMADAGNVAWDMGSYGWLLQGKDFQSIHPSLQRQAVLNMAYGLYEVLPGKIYQVRGYDLANISFIKGDTGWIVFDPLTAKETARAALQFINEKLGARPVLAVVYSHSHVDHFGGVRGVADEADVASGKVKVIAPEGFMQAAIEENVFTGNAMSRRTQYSYAVLLPRDPFGHVDQSIGKNVANGNVGLIAPTVLIKKDFETITVDGVEMVFQNTPDTEAPVEMNTWFPQFKALWAAENITGTIHNIYTPRGAPVRNALNWSKEINVALYKFGQDAEVMFAGRPQSRDDGREKLRRSDQGRQGDLHGRQEALRSAQEHHRRVQAEFRDPAGNRRARGSQNRRGTEPVQASRSGAGRRRGRLTSQVQVAATIAATALKTQAGTLAALSLRARIASSFFTSSGSQASRDVTRA
jgi:alkyl sulfatase BDS1-like metallo-beta-lactamase superfamily hydrolase